MNIVVLDGWTLNPGDLSWSGIERHGDLTVTAGGCGDSRRSRQATS